MLTLTLLPLHDGRRTTSANTQKHRLKKKRNGKTHFTKSYKLSNFLRLIFILFVFVSLLIRLVLFMRSKVFWHYNYNSLNFVVAVNSWQFLYFLHFSFVLLKQFFLTRNERKKMNSEGEEKQKN